MPKAQTQHSIPLESQEAALETLFEFVKNTRLEYAYQMLLLLTLLYQSDSNGFLTLELFLIMQLCTTLPQPLAEIVPTSQKSVNRNR